MEKEILNRLSALAHERRLQVFRLLARRYPDSVPAGEVARALEIKPNTLSVYLSTLAQAGLITQTREGTSLLYRVEWPAARAMIDFLFQDCCLGRPDLCPAEVPIELPRRKLNVLFICSGNSARSIFAEAILRDLAGDRFQAFSAGTKPRADLNPLAVTTLQSMGHDVSTLRPKSISEFQAENAPQMDFVFTVCDQAANEECATWFGQPISAHWGIADPARATGTEAEKRLAFQQAYEQLRNRIKAFAALPFDTLDRASLQRRVDELAANSGDNL